MNPHTESLTIRRNFVERDGFWLLLHTSLIRFFTYSPVHGAPGMGCDRVSWAGGSARLGKQSPFPVWCLRRLAILTPDSGRLTSQALTPCFLSVFYPSWSFMIGVR